MFQKNNAETKEEIHFDKSYAIKTDYWLISVYFLGSYPKKGPVSQVL